MTGVVLKRWALGLVVAGLVPLAAGGAGCGGKDDSPEAAAGHSSTSGNAAGGSTAGNPSSGSATGGGTGTSGGSAAGGSAAGGSAAGGSAAGGSAAGGSAAGGSAAGGAARDCCNSGDREVCMDGEHLKRCALVPGNHCDGSPSIYVNVWEVQSCPNGCGSGGVAGAGPACK